MEERIIGQELRPSPKTQKEGPKASCKCSEDTMLHTVIVIDIFKMFVAFIVMKIILELIKKYN